MNWSDETIVAFRKALLTWYDENKRELPWRADTDPYHVMVSELMLQQTQVQTVIPYYERFMARFPTVQALAEAPEAAVLKAWEGLGYYSRARNLQKAAKQLTLDYNGQWPTTAAELVNLSGIGPYTAGAIASIAFNEPVPAVDGNAFRVFARLMEIPDDIAKPQTRKLFEQIIARVIDPKRPGDFNQAIMDLGSSYMRAKDPDPANSPVRAFDASYQNGTVLNYPVKTKKAKPVVKPYFAVAIRSSAGWLLEQRPSTGMLANLWAFPLIDREQFDAPLVAEELSEASELMSQQVGTPLSLALAGAKLVKHTFTHQQWQLTLVVADTPAFALDYLPARWVSDLSSVALPTVQKKLFSALEECGK